jgi:eukaryotic-like serine/threonine-protein kinase
MTQPRLLGGRYELDGVVGRGGMAEVYRARDIRLDRVVAVKTLRSDLARDQTFQARFRREAQSAASLNHPAVVAVYDTGEDMIGGIPVPYIVMEYVDGRTLRDLMRDGRRLLPERALEILDGVLRALEYSHRGGIVHRDIKPGNVMLTRNGEVKVMDFGIARAMSDTQATMTQTAQVIGTAQYLSPEQAKGERVDARSDLYSAGCLMYELLTGRPPFTGESAVAIAYQHVRENPIPPTQLDPELPPWADSVVLKAMSKEQAERYQNAAEMRADVQRAMAGLPVSAPTEMMHRTQRMGGGTMVAPPTSGIPPYEYGEEEEPPSGRGRRAALWTLFGLVVLGVVIAVALLLLNSGGQTYAVPDVVGKTQVQATAAIQQAHLNPRVIQQHSGSVRKGLVISTSPSVGNKLPAGSNVTVDVSAGQKQVQVPSVIGQQQSQAQQALGNAGLTAKVVADSKSTAPQGQVTGENPPAGTTVNPGSTVTIRVSGGGSGVPNVVNEPKATAIQILQAAGFQVNPDTVQGPQGATPGNVFQQTPNAGTTLAKGSTVTIFVAKAAPSPPPSPTLSPGPTDTVSPPGL